MWHYYGYYTSYLCSNDLQILKYLDHVINYGLDEKIMWSMFVRATTFRFFILTATNTDLLLMSLSQVDAAGGLTLDTVLFFE